MDRQAIRKDSNRFFIGETPEQVLAEITYFPSDDGRIVIDHTFVDTSLKGQGIGQMLVEQVVALARSENRRILAQCSFARKVILNCAECRDLLDPDEEDPFDT